MAAALLTPRPASLLVLNEPETSLHADLLPALAGLIMRAAGRAQVIVVSHASPLIRAIKAAAGAPELSMIELIKDFGETAVAGPERLNGPRWTWPKR
jgi:predicted ATPase